MQEDTRPLIEELRRLGDAMDEIVDEDSWTMPTYAHLRYKV